MFWEFDMYYNLLNFFKNLPMFIKMAWYWRPWDFRYVIQVMIPMMEKNRDDLGSGFVVLGKNELKHYNIAINCLKRYHNERYCEKEINDLYKEYDVKPLEFRQRSKEFSEKLMKITKHEGYLERQDLDMALKMIRKYSMRWWT